MAKDALKMLVVDDHALLHKMIGVALRESNVGQMDSTNNGRDALEKINQAKVNNAIYDVVFLDWNMPEMNGFEVLKSCRKDRELNKMAIIMVTAEAEPESIVKAMNAGATAYITKPFTRDIVVEKLKDVEIWKDKLSKKSN